MSNADRDGGKANTATPLPTQSSKKLLACCPIRQGSGMNNRELLSRHPGGIHGYPPRPDRQRAIVLVRHQQAPFQAARQFGFLRAGETDVLRIPVGDHQRVGGNLRHGGAAAGHKSLLAGGLDNIEAIELRQRGDRRAGAFNGGDSVAPHGGRQLRHVDQVEGHTSDWQSSRTGSARPQPPIRPVNQVSKR